MGGLKGKSFRMVGPRGAAPTLRRVAVAAFTLWLVACGGPEGAGHNVLLIVIDTLRVDHVGVYGYERPTTQEIDSWAKDGAVFDRAFVPSP